MRQKLFVIEDIFQITGRGIIVTGELESNSPVFKIGSKIVLIRPNREKFDTEVAGFNFSKLANNLVGVLLKNIVSKEEVPIGTEVFLKT